MHCVFANREIKCIVVLRFIICTSQALQICISTLVSPGYDYRFVISFYGILHEYQLCFALISLSLSLSEHWISICSSDLSRKQIETYGILFPQFHYDLPFATKIICQVLLSVGFQSDKNSFVIGKE